MTLLKDAMEKEKNDILDGELKYTYNKIQNKGDLGSHFKINDGLLKIYPTEDPKQIDSVYVTGPAGSGKSYFCSEFIEEYKKRYPKRPIILFSNKPEDEILDQWNPMRIPLNKNLVIDPIELEELEESLVVFDDIDQITDKDIQNAVWKLRDQILEVGRAKQISTCIVAHQITNYKQSRVCLNECSYVVMFCKSGARHGINYFLKKYAGLDKKTVAEIMNLPSRWVVLKKTYPMCVIYQTGCMAL